MLGHSEEFIKLLADNQYRLRGFILASIGDHTNAADILQQTNVVLWQKADSLSSPDAFLPWALRVARFEVLAFLRDRKRERLLFGIELAELISTEAELRIDELPGRREALRECLKRTPGDQLRVLEEKYAQNKDVQSIAKSAGRSVESIKSILKRTRKKLADCIERRLSACENIA